jgi:hypothetical protein
VSTTKIESAKADLGQSRRLLERELRALDAPLFAFHPNQVLTFSEWCRINRISERTGRRILAGGNGPTVTELSAKRIGITIEANRRWQASRERA